MVSGLRTSPKERCKIFSGEDNPMVMELYCLDVSTGFECGIGCDRFSNWKEGDIIEAFKMVTKKRSLSK